MSLDPQTSQRIRNDFGVSARLETALWFAIEQFKQSHEFSGTRYCRRWPMVPIKTLSINESNVKRVLFPKRNRIQREPKAQPACSRIPGWSIQIRNVTTSSKAECMFILTQINNAKEKLQLDSTSKITTISHDNWAKLDKPQRITGSIQPQLNHQSF